MDPVTEARWCVAEAKVKVAIIGLGFGAEFIPIYQAHPNTNVIAICRRNQEELNKTGDQFGVDRRYRNRLTALEFCLSLYRLPYIYPSRINRHKSNT